MDTQYVSSSDTEDLKKRQEAEEFLQSYKVEEEPSASTNDSDAPIEKPFNPKEINIKSKTMSLDNIIKRIRESEAEIKNQAQKFITDLNATLPEVMELEYEGFYRRGFFVSKKRYAVIEDGEIIAKGLELVRRDWAPIVKQTQKDVLKDILKEGNTTKAINTVKKVLKRLKTGKIEGKELIIHTQITKPLSEYKQIGPHVVAAKKMEEHGIKITKGTIIQYVIVKGKGSISQRAVPYDYSEGAEYDRDYYINNQMIPAIGRIMYSLGYTKQDLEDLAQGEKQTSLDAFF